MTLGAEAPVIPVAVVEVQHLRHGQVDRWVEQQLRRVASRYQHQLVPVPPPLDLSESVAPAGIVGGGVEAGLAGEDADGFAAVPGSVGADKRGALPMYSSIRPLS